MAIASLGGAIVSKDGTRQYPASGGMVGGLSFDGGNWAYFGGAGKSYNRFTPSANLIEPPVDNLPIDPNSGGRVITDTGGGGGGGGGGGAIPTGSPTSAPTWLQGIFSSTYNGQPISLNVNSSGQATANLGGQSYGGYIFQYLNQFYLWLNGDTSLITQHGTNGIETQNLTRGGILDYLGLTTALTPTTNTDRNPTVIPVQSDTSILQALGGLLAPQNQTYQAPPSLFQVAPTGQSSTSSGVNMKSIAILAVVGIVAYFLYKKYMK